MSQVPWKLSPAQDGSLLVASILGTTSPGTVLWDNAADLALEKLSADFSSTLWRKTLSSFGFERPKAFVQPNRNVYYAFGAYGGTAAIDDQLINGIGHEDIFFLKFQEAQNPPLISLDLTNAAPLAGSPFTFTVQVESALPLRYQWFFQNQPLTNATNATLLIPALSLANSGAYFLRVSNSLGSAQSSTAYVDVQSAPQITKGPAPQNVLSGDTATFAADVIGTPPVSYQWFSGARQLVGQTAATLVLTNVTFADEGTYNVLVSNAVGQVRSDAARLLVFDRPVRIVTIAGSGNPGNLDSDNALQAKLNTPDGPSIDASGGTYFADIANNNLRYLSAGGALKTLAGGGRVGYLDAVSTNALFSSPYAARVLQNGNVVIADSENDVLRLFFPTNGVVRTFAGSGTRGYSNGPASSARFAAPREIVEAPDASLYVTDLLNHTVRKVLLNGTVRTLAGSGSAGYTNGTGTAAKFNQPLGITLAPDGNFYVADSGNHRIRKITATGVVSTVAGDGTPGYNNGASNNAEFSTPDGIVAAPNGDLYVCDKGNHMIRRITPAGLVSTIAGLGTAGFADGDQSVAMFNSPTGIDIARDGSLVVTDSQNQRLRRIIPRLAPPTILLTLLPSIGGTPLFQLTATAEPLSPIRIESSSNLRDWTVIKRATLDNSGTLQLPGAVTPGATFFRAVTGSQ